MSDKMSESVQMDATTIEQVLISRDLSKLTAPQRVQYYQKVCQSLGLNPFTKPFEYITLNGKLTLYAKKDATDQLRNLHSVNIDDVDIVETATQFIVKVKGHNKEGRADVEVGVVNKTDMQGNTANAQMKAVTKGKRRLTLSLCGLGWLDETEIETIPSARPVTVVPETGEIVTGEIVDPEPTVTKSVAPTTPQVRPFTPDHLRELLYKKANTYGDMPAASDKQIGLLASMLELPFAGDPDATKIRHSCIKYMFGVESLKEMDGALVKATLDWLKPEKAKDGSGEYVIDALASRELSSIWPEALKASGQQELL